MPFQLSLPHQPSCQIASELARFGGSLEWSVGNKNLDADLSVVTNHPRQVVIQFAIERKNYSVAIEVVTTVRIDSLAIVLGSLLEPCLRPSFTGAAFVDWEDIKSALAMANGKCRLQFSEHLEASGQAPTAPIMVTAFIETTGDPLSYGRKLHKWYRPHILAIQVADGYQRKGVSIIEAG